jgi:hypothetical protein
MRASCCGKSADVLMRRGRRSRGEAPLQSRRVPQGEHYLDKNDSSPFVNCLAASQYVVMNSFLVARQLPQMDDRSSAPEVLAGGEGVQKPFRTFGTHLRNSLTMVLADGLQIALFAIISLPQSGGKMVGSVECQEWT